MRWTHATVFAMICRTSASVAILLGLVCASAEATALSRLKQTFGIWTANAPRTVRFPDSFEVGASPTTAALVHA